jgi:hypothetical protein
MTPRPVALYLGRFGDHERPESAREKLFELDDIEEPVEEPAAASRDDEQRAREKARDEGYAEGFAAASHEQEEMRRAEHLAFEQRIVKERDRWTQDEGARLGAKMEAALAEIETRIGASAARILRPFLVRQAGRRAIDELAESLMQMLSGSRNPLVEITGPEDLLAALQTKLAGSAACAVWTPGPTMDVRIIADQTLIESRIQAWIQRIEASPK